MAPVKKENASVQKGKTARKDKKPVVKKDKKSVIKKVRPQATKQAEDKVRELQSGENLDKLEGRNPVLEALRSGRSINRILVSKGEKEGSIKHIIALAKQKHIVIQEIDRTRLDAMSETKSHQGIIALAAAKDYVSVDDILKAAADSGRPPFIVILDEITDPNNLGSILRTSNAAGVHGVIIPKRRAIGLTSAVSKASAGAIEYVPVARVTNLVQTIEYLKKQNIWVVGTDASAERPYFDHDLTGGIALVIGSEGEGMSRLVREACDFTVNIPMAGEISSLNAAVAGAIVMYEIVRQREERNRLSK
ncbi:MAG TPA: 23S rRNA (guanosine(2251)-2'-O)-methyltransferase RlmB [Clostridiales bacterium]|nr:23S rRNA (guanosine(2251)-2'-O)-methyltransferase RlmB [Clostridiales bacterium]